MTQREQEIRDRLEAYPETWLTADIRYLLKRIHKLEDALKAFAQEDCAGACGCEYDCSLQSIPLASSEAMEEDQ
jgi:hypothetical protein